MHKLMSVPLQDISMSFKGEEVEFLLSTLMKVHNSLVATLSDPKATEEERKSAYDFAYNTEVVYASIFKQLKLNKPKRLELN